ncbi:MAG TPA: YceI family protein [Bryobacteraceae bacterium]|jgi:polyisoprenoid-binding protein YceI
MNRRSILFLGGAALVSNLFSKMLTTLAPAADATFVLEVEKTGILAGKKHRFVFTDYHGQVSDGAPSDGGKQVIFTVHSASIQCEDTWVNDKDRGKILKYALNEMLKVDQYPEIRYVSSAIHERGGNSFSIDGNLTIGLKTRPVSVCATRQLDGASKPWWNGSAVISLSDFGLKAPTAALGTIGTKDKMQLSFHLAAL